MPLGPQATPRKPGLEIKSYTWETEGMPRSNWKGKVQATSPWLNVGAEMETLQAIRAVSEPYAHPMVKVTKKAQAQFFPNKWLMLK